MPDIIYSALNGLETFDSNIDGWNRFLSAQLTTPSTLSRSADNGGSLLFEYPQTQRATNPDYSEGFRKYFINPMDTKFTRIRFDYRVRINPEISARVNNLYLTIVHSTMRRALSNQRLLARLIYRGGFIHEGRPISGGLGALPTPHDSQWTNVSIPIDIDEPYVWVQFHTENSESVGLGKKIWIDNLALLREPIDGELDTLELDLAPRKRYPQNAAATYQRITGNRYVPTPRERGR